MKSILVIITFAITVSVLAFGSEVRGQDASKPPEQVSFPTQDGGLIYANLYGKGDRVSCWLTEADSIRRVGRSRRGYW